MKSLSNIPASIRQRLLNRSKTDRRPFNELLQYYAMERFLYRLSISSHAQNYILKGALMLRVWDAPEIRPTMDIDMLGRTNNKEKNIIAQIGDILAVEVKHDGLLFDSESIRTEQINEDAGYKGIRVRFPVFLGKSRISMQIDIGFGDKVYPEPKKSDLPCLLDFPSPSLLCYSRESAIAEKFEAIIKLGYLNSRMKNFYDIWLMARRFPFELSNLAKAIELTFKQRGTELKQPVEAFSTEYISSHQKMWAAFRRRMAQDHIPSSFQDIVIEIQSFLSPVIEGVSESKKWTPAGPWS